jgi:hypothetical protein
VYAHAPTNKDYLTIFLCSWLAESNKFPISWAQYAYDTTQEQMKRGKKPSFSLKRNYSIISYLKQMSQFGRGLELNDNENYIVLEGPQKLIIFLPNQIAIVKELLEEVKVFEQSRKPRRSTLQFEKEKLKNEAIEVSLNLRDKNKQLEEEKSNIIKMEAKQQKKFDVKT